MTRGLMKWEDFTSNLKTHFYSLKDRSHDKVTFMMVVLIVHQVHHVIWRQFVSKILPVY